MAKDIHTTYPVSSVMSIGGPLITRTGTVKAEGPVEDESSSKAAGIVAKVDNNADNLFIEDVSPRFFGGLLCFIDHILPDSVCH